MQKEAPAVMKITSDTILVSQSNDRSSRSRKIVTIVYLSEPATLNFASLFEMQEFVTMVDHVRDILGSDIVAPTKASIVCH
jgi:hypothetical protein